MPTQQTSSDGTKKLSACETNVGLRRAGLMIASLRDSLHAAGVRRAVTTLWKVPGRAAMELMSELYRRVWQNGEDVSTALWEAKKKLQAARDERTGGPLFGVADWAAFIPSGVPEDGARRPEDQD